MLHSGVRFRVGSQDVRDPNPRRLNRRRLRKAGVDVAQGLKRSDHEGRAHDQHECERDLHDDQSVARRVPLTARARPARGAGQGRIDVQRVLECRNRAEQECRRERDGHGEPEHGRIDCDFLEARQVARTDGNEALQPDVCEHQPKHAAGCAYYYALDEQLFSDSRRHCAERGAYSELLPPCVGPHEHEIRDVGAGDEKHGADCTHEHPQHARDATDQVVLQGSNDGGDSHVLEDFGCQPDTERPRPAPDPQHALDVGMSLGRGDAGLEPRDALKADVERDRLRGRGSEPHGDDHVGLRRHVEESEVGRHDADDFRRLRIDLELTPDGRFIGAESPLPERMREDDRSWPFDRGPVLRFRESASAHRLHAERLKCAVRDSKSA